jgi:hypothetical protein
MTSTTESPNVDDALSGLVSQFSSALDCYRELVQNSIDAGSPRVDVWMEFLPGESGRGTIAIHVDDFGEGMDETIINTQLTRLFSSAKENDLTKIGKFGIGFVSVFALRPKAVLIHTGRGGEYWEVLFHEDRTYAMTTIETPVEGTQITLFIAGDWRRYAELVTGSRAALERWCSHSDTEITFEDRSATNAAGAEPINQPFEVDGDLMTVVEHQGTEIVLAYTRRPNYGFYNRGLTLLSTADAEDALGEDGARFRHVGFRIKSRYLEHTLSRETILRDRSYEKAVDLLYHAAGEALLPALIRELVRLAASEQLGVHNLERFTRLLSFLADEPAELLLKHDSAQILRTVDGRTSSLAAVARAARSDGRIFVAAHRSALTDILAEQGVPVLLGRDVTRHTGDASDLGTRGPDVGPVRHLLLTYLVTRDRSSWLGRLHRYAGINLRASATRPSEWMSYDPVTHYGAMLADPHDTYLAVELVRHLPRSARDLIEGAGQILAGTDAGYARLAACRLESPELDPPLFLVGRKLGRVMARPPRKVLESERPRRPRAVVNLEHPQLVALAELYVSRPAMAVYCLAKNLLLEEDRLLHLDGELMKAAREAHPERATAKRG